MVFLIQDPLCLSNTFSSVDPESGLSQDLGPDIDSNYPFQSALKQVHYLDPAVRVLSSVSGSGNGS